MKFHEKYDKVVIGVISGLILPVIVGITIWLATSGHQSLHSYLSRISDSGIITHSITLCVFPNVIIFLIFNRFDMLRATRGVLAITIVWAILVFGIKIL